MQCREVAVKVLYEGDVPHAIILQNGSLKFFRLEPISYGEVDELFDARETGAIDEVDD